MQTTKLLDYLNLIKHFFFSWEWLYLQLDIEHYSYLLGNLYDFLVMQEHNLIFIIFCADYKLQLQKNQVVIIYI